jgi:hypothetical protein
LSTSARLALDSSLIRPFPSRKHDGGMRRCSANRPWNAGNPRLTLATS